MGSKAPPVTFGDSPLLVEGALRAPRGDSWKIHGIATPVTSVTGSQ